MKKVMGENSHGKSHTRHTEIHTPFSISQNAFITLHTVSLSELAIIYELRRDLRDDSR